MFSSQASSLATVEYITDELCRIVGHGPGPQRLAHMPWLRRVSGAERVNEPLHAGSMVASHVLSVIRGIDEPIYFDGRYYEPDVAQRAFAINLGFNESECSSMHRRTDVIRLLGRYYGMDTWRRDRERKFLHILGVEIYSAFNPEYRSAKPLPASTF